MVDNKSKTPLILHIQKKKYTTHKDYNNIYNIVIFIHDIFFLYMSFRNFLRYKIQHTDNKSFYNRVSTVLYDALNIDYLMSCH